MTRTGYMILWVLAYVFTATASHAGGPLLIGGPQIGTAGQPLLWPTGTPIAYRVDGGPLASTPGGVTVIDNAAGTSRVGGMFSTWQAVPTANISYQNAGSILAVGSFAGGDVQTATDFDAVEGSCGGGVQSPIVFDANGSIFADLIGDPNVIGFAGPCALDSAGHILSAEAVLNGVFQDGIDSADNFELTAAEFDQAFVHEFGHFSGLDHSQANLAVLDTGCPLDTNAGLPVMFPVLVCPARVSAGLPALAPDDAAWISYLYPVTSSTPGKQTFNSVYGLIRGTVYFSDGVTGAQGVNLLARSADNPGTAQDEALRTVISVVSGYRFTGNPGQTVTCGTPDDLNTCSNAGGSQTGSRDTAMVGWFVIPVPAGQYTLSVESVYDGFTGGSSLNPLDPPIPMPGTAAPISGIQVTAGGTVDVQVVLQGTPPRFDSFESAWSGMTARPWAGKDAGL